MLPSLASFIRDMPKVELHVHLEGAIQPATLLKLAKRHHVALPADDVEGLRRWYRFENFDKFVEVYLTISGCIRTVEDIEMVALEFLRGQAAQNIQYSEVTYTAHTHYAEKGLAFDAQLAALNRARKQAQREWGVQMNLVIDIPRFISAEEGSRVADWVIASLGNGVVALGLGGPEKDHPPTIYREAFRKAHAAGVPCVPHAGETDGPSSIWSALDVCHAVRIGHGVTCLEDDALVDTLRERRLPLEVCPTSNLCLNLFPNLAAHPLPQLLDAGLIVTLGSDDPPMFNTSLTDEYAACAQTFQFDHQRLQQLVLNGVHASLLPEAEIQARSSHYKAAFEDLAKKHGLKVAP